MNAGKPERRLVSYGFIDGTLEHCLDSSPCAVVHAVVEFEVADREFSVIDVEVQCVELGLVKKVVHAKLGVEPLDCIEILPLEGVIERLAEIEVSQFRRRSSSFRADGFRWPITRSFATLRPDKGQVPRPGRVRLACVSLASITSPQARWECCRNAVRPASIPPALVLLLCGR